MGEIVKLYERMEDKKAEREFAQAFVALQAEMPAVKALRAVPNRDGSTRYNFAPYEEIMDQIAPMLKRHGFTVTFSTDFGEGQAYQDMHPPARQRAFTSPTSSPCGSAAALRVQPTRRRMERLQPTPSGSPCVIA